jgi:DNA invertase Pin-like site-specific DNA recombinase
LSSVLFAATSPTRQQTARPLRDRDRAFANRARGDRVAQADRQAAGRARCVPALSRRAAAVPGRLCTGAKGVSYLAGRFDTVRGVPHVAKLLDRACPRCGAPAGIKCRDRRNPRRSAASEHIARGWLDRRCPTCDAWPDEPCLTPSGRRSAKPHTARWQQRRQPAQRYGYARVAADRRDSDDDEIQALRAAGCVRVWTDRLPTVGDPTTTQRTQLLAYLRAEDVLVVWRLDRLACTALELAELVGALRARRIGLCSLDEDLDTTRPGGEQLFAAITAIARLHPVPGATHDNTTARAAPAHPSGAKGGRPRLLDEHAHARLRALYDAGEHTVDQIAAAFSVSRPTVYRSLKRTTSQNGL